MESFTLTFDRIVLAPLLKVNVRGHVWKLTDLLEFTIQSGDDGGLDQGDCGRCGRSSQTLGVF